MDITLVVPVWGSQPNVPCWRVKALPIRSCSAFSSFERTVILLGTDYPIPGVRVVVWLLVEVGAGECDEEKLKGFRERDEVVLRFRMSR